MSSLKTKRKLLVLAIASISYSGSLQAVPMVDGILNPGTEYATGATLNLGFFDEGSDLTGEIAGTFHYVIEGGLIYAAISAPTDFTDNIYGDLAKSTAAGYDKERTFDKLLGSDRLLFGLDTDNDGDNDISVVIDYLAKEIGGNFDDKNSKLDLKGSDKGSAASDAVNGTNNVYVVGTDDGEPDPYRAMFGQSGGNVVSDVATSLEYNLSAGCGDDTESPDTFTSPCSAVLTYEWSMAANAFSNFSETSILAPLMHSSPSKVDHNSVFEPHQWIRRKK